MAGQLQQLAAHVRGYSQALTHSDRVCQHLSSQVDSLRAQVELEQERQPLDALIRQHDRARAEKLREQQPEPQKNRPATTVLIVGKYG